MSDETVPGVGAIYRQGDVLLRRVAQLPAVDLVEIPRERNRIVLAHVEFNGHAHAIDAPIEEATFLSARDQRRFLRLVRDVDLRHEEHATINLPAGTYEVIQQREWTDAKHQEEIEEERWRYAGD
jgi:hypothetical protein